MEKKVMLLISILIVLSLFGCEKQEEEKTIGAEISTESSEDEVVESESSEKEGKIFNYEECQGYEIVYNIPKSWIKLYEQTYENNEVIELAYAPPGEGNVKNYFHICTTTNLNNIFVSQEGMCDYLLHWLPEPYEYENETLTQISVEDYECTVPAKHAVYRYVADDATIDYQYYVLLLSEDSVFMMIYYHDVSSEEEYYKEFEEAISSLQHSDFSYSIYEKKLYAEKDFTNKYGTPTTRCAHLGCDNYIAFSGDTNCCTSHSNNCLECGKYIDEDAIFCMSCLSGK